MKTNPLLGWLFLAPALFLMTVFLIYPTIRTVQLSFDTGEGFTTTQYVGVDNYVKLFTSDRNFFKVNEFPPSGAVFNTLLWLFTYVPITIGLGLILAVLANSVRYEVPLKTIIFIPMGISFTAAAIIWRFVYSGDPNTGVLNAIIKTFTADPSFNGVKWLGRGDLINPAMIIAGTWTATGFCLVILSAALKGLPKEVMEAALVDGATAWTRFIRITVPMLWPTIVVLITTSTIGVLKAFDLVYIMIGNNTRGRTIGLSMFIETFDNNKPGYGSAVAVVMLIVVLPFIIFNIRRFRAEG